MTLKTYVIFLFYNRLRKCQLCFIKLYPYKMKKTLFLLLVWVISISTLSWCSNLSTSQNKWPEIIKIWVIAPLSGPAASFGEDWVNFYKYIVDRFNSENSWKIQIELVIEDWKCSGKDSTSAAQKLIMIDKVDMIRWWMCSSETIAAWKISQANKVFTIAPISSAPEISDIWDYVYRFYNDTETAKQLAPYAYDNFKNIALLVENTDYAMWLRTKFKQEYKWDILVDDVFQSDEKDFAILVSKLKWKGIDWLILLTQSESTTISVLKAIQSAELWDIIKRTVWVYICSADTFLKSSSDIAEWMSCFDLPPMEYLSQESKDFIQEYKKTNTINAFPSRIVLQKETADMTLDAIKKWNYTSDSIKKYFENINQSNPREWYFGSVYFNNQRELIWLPYVVEKIENWKIKIIK